jgi:hypothetical protein
VKRPRQHRGPSADIKPDVNRCDPTMGADYEPTTITCLTPQSEVEGIDPTAQRQRRYLPYRKAWWLKAWPSVADQTQEPVRRRILSLMTVAPYAGQDCPGAETSPPSAPVARLQPSASTGRGRAINLRWRGSCKGIP